MLWIDYASQAMGTIQRPIRLHMLALTQAVLTKRSTHTQLRLHQEVLLSLVEGITFIVLTIVVLLIITHRTIFIVVTGLLLLDLDLVNSHP